MQKNIINGITVLTADNGMKLTNGSSFGSVVYLGKNDTEANWHEVTEAEAEKLMEVEGDELTETEQKALAYDILMGVGE